MGRILTLRHSVTIPDGGFAPWLSTYTRCLNLQCSAPLRLGLPNLMCSMRVTVHLRVEWPHGHHTVCHSPTATPFVLQEFIKHFPISCFPLSSSASHPRECTPAFVHVTCSWCIHAGFFPLHCTLCSLSPTIAGHCL